MKRTTVKNINKSCHSYSRKRFWGMLAVEVVSAVLFLSVFLFICTFKLSEDDASVQVDVPVHNTGETEQEGDKFMPNLEKTPPKTKPLSTQIPAEEGKSIKNFLLTAKKPIGKTMYVWGGGWNESDTGAGDDAKRIGMSPRWKQFADGQDSSYDYRKTKHQIHDGLDCSGYIGWVVYNIFETEDDKDGYVVKSTDMAENFADRGFGTYKPASQVNDWRAGDVMSMPGHVWISLGMCSDSSVVVLNASPPGVILKGTLNPDGSRSKAVELAEYYMEKYYPDWYAKFPDCSASYAYITNSSQMRWDRNVLSDDEKFSEQGAEEVLHRLFDTP